MLYIGGINKTFGQNVAVSIDKLKVDHGKLIGLVGNNGAGKTTLFRLILDLVEPDEGIIEIKNHSVKQNDHWKGKTGAFLDDKFLIPYLTPREYWEFIIKMKQLDIDLDQQLEKYQGLLTDDITSKKYIRELSAGNKARAGIIGALLGEPDLVILDEPFANLDPSSQNFLVKLLKNRPSGQTALISSHDLNHIKSLSDEIVLMENGKIIKHVSQAERAEVMAYFQ